MSMRLLQVKCIEVHSSSRTGQARRKRGQVELTPPMILKLMVSQASLIRCIVLHTIVLRTISPSVAASYDPGTGISVPKMVSVSIFRLML